MSPAELNKMTPQAKAASELFMVCVANPVGTSHLQMTVTRFTPPEPDR